MKQNNINSFSIIFNYITNITNNWWKFIRFDRLVEMFKRFCYMSKLWDFESQLYQCILYADFE